MLDRTKPSLFRGRDVVARAVDLGVSKVKLAKAAGVTPQAVNGWRKTGRIGQESLVRVAPLLQWTVAEALGIEEKSAKEITSGQLGQRGDTDLSWFASAYKLLTDEQQHKLRNEIESMARANLVFHREIGGKLTFVDDAEVSRFLSSAPGAPAVRVKAKRKTT